MIDARSGGFFYHDRARELSVAKDARVDPFARIVPVRALVVAAVDPDAPGRSRTNESRRVAPFRAASRMGFLPRSFRLWKTIRSCLRFVRIFAGFVDFVAAAVEHIIRSAGAARSIERVEDDKSVGCRRVIDPGDPQSLGSHEVSVAFDERCFLQCEFREA